MNTKHAPFTAICAAFCALISTAALAIETTWKGGLTGAWDVPANWTDGIPQTSADTANGTLDGATPDGPLLGWITVTVLDPLNHQSLLANRAQHSL